MPANSSDKLKQISGTELCNLFPKYHSKLDEYVRSAKTMDEQAFRSNFETARLKFHTSQSKTLSNRGLTLEEHDINFPISRHKSLLCSLHNYFQALKIYF